MATLIDGYCCLINKLNTSIWKQAYISNTEDSLIDGNAQNRTLKRGLSLKTEIHFFS